MSWPWRRGIQAQLLVLLVGLLSAVLLIVNLSMGWLLTRAQVEEAANHLQIQSLIAARSLEDPLSAYSHELEEHERREQHTPQGKRDDDDREDTPGLLSEWVHRFASESGSKVTVTDSSGRPLASTASFTTLLAEDLSWARAGKPHHRVDGGQIFAVAPVMRKGHLLGVVQLSTPKRQALQRSGLLVANIALASAATLIVALMAAIWFSRRLVGPIKRLEKIAALTAKGEWDHRFPTEGQDEIAGLARTFAQMLEALKSLMQRQRQFVSDASHELRTPLTRMKIRTEALLDGALDDPPVAGKFLKEIDSEIDRMSALTSSLLDLARYDERAARAQATGEAASLLAEAAAAHRSSAEQKEIALELRVPDTLPSLPISREALALIVNNLLSNAIKFTPAGGTVSLSVEHLSKEVRILVKDSGMGIAAEHLPHLFERFYRADPSRTAGGSGLGLALVKSAVESAGGSVEVQSTPGEGSTFIVTLPAADPSPS